MHDRGGQSFRQHDHACDGKRKGSREMQLNKIGRGFPLLYDVLKRGVSIDFNTLNPLLGLTFRKEVYLMLL